MAVRRMGKATLARQAPTLLAGRGPPIMVGRGDTQRLLADGAGLCSPGLWRPQRRHPPTGIALELFRALSEELDLLASSTQGGLNRMLADIASGRVASDPFPADATERLRSWFECLSRAHKHAVDHDEVLQDQPVDVLLLGRLLWLMGDPDWAIMGTYATGVPLGLGVDLPRTPDVFPPKTRDSLKEQAEWGGDSERAAGYRGTIRGNDPSAVSFAYEMDKALRAQQKQGKVLVLSEKVAKERYGDRLPVASLSALEKSVAEDGEVEVRVLLDGTHGVDTNRYIKVLDGGTSPTAQDLKTCMRHQASRGTPHFGITLDVEGAHQVVAVRPFDWPLQA